jgi:hypothetical protein
MGMGENINMLPTIVIEMEGKVLQELGVSLECFVFRGGKVDGSRPENTKKRVL